MKIIAVYLSTRNGSVSEQIMDELMAGAEEAGATVSRYKVGDSILGCRGCGGCVKAGACVVNDPLKPYWEELKEADLVVVSAANYMGNVMGQGWAFMNRHYCLADSSRGMQNRTIRIPAGKKIVGVFSQGSPNKDAYREVYQKYLRFFAAYGMEPQEPIVVNAGDVAAESLIAYRAQGRSWVHVN